MRIENSQPTSGCVSSCYGHTVLSSEDKIGKKCMIQKDKASSENSDVTEILELPEREFKMEIVRKSQKKFRK